MWRPYTFGLLLLLAACESTSGGTSPDASSPVLSDAAGSAPIDAAQDSAPDFASPGPHQVQSESAQLTVSDCQLDYTLFRPTAAEGPVVILGHGFSRSPQQLADLASHLASHGLVVATPAYCHLSAFDTDHEANGEHAAALASHLSASDPVVFAGHSAGGLAALLGAAQSDQVAALVGLDLVDADALGLGAAPQLDAPTLGLVGEPTQCNSDNNALPVLAAASDAIVLRVRGATHCSFESPTDGLCTGFCGGDGTADRALIFGLTTAFILWQTGLKEEGADWLQPDGQRYQELLSGSVIEAL